MSARYLFGIRKNGNLKCSNIAVSSLEDLSQKVKSLLTETSIENLEKAYENTTLVDDMSIPDKEQAIKYKKLNLSKKGLSESEENDWYKLTYEIQKDLSKWLKMAQKQRIEIINNIIYFNDFSTSGAYIIDLDDETLEYYIGAHLMHKYSLMEIKESFNLDEENTKHEKMFTKLCLNAV